MSDNASAVTLIATFRAIAGHAEEVMGLITDYAKAVRDEPGNVFFDVYTDVDDAHSFVVIERYLNQDAFEDHLNAKKGEAFNAVLGPLVEGGGSALQFLRAAPE